MMNFRDWLVRFKLIVPLLLVVVLGSGGIIAAFTNMFDKITLVELPEERTLNRVGQASLELLGEYREFMVAPSNSTLREIDELKIELEAFKGIFEHPEEHVEAHAHLNASIEAGIQDLIEHGDAVIGQRRRILSQIRSLELFEVSFDSAPTTDLARKESGQNFDADALVDDYFSKLREYALSQEVETLSELEEIELALEKLSQGGSTSDEAFRVQQVLEVGRAIVSLSGGLLTALESLEESEEILLDALGEASAVVAQETDDAFTTGFIQVGVVILAVLLLISAVGYWVSQRIARPVRNLAVTANRFGEGELSARAAVESMDEIGELAAVFNRMAENLESNIVQREQAEEQLRQSQKMEAVGQLTGGVAHDFNNLLAVILGNAELLDEELGDEKTERLEPLIRAAKRGAELTDSLLTFSRKQALRPQPVELTKVFEDMYGLLSRSLGATIEIETTASPGAWNLTADPGQLENAVLNLALNARDAMPDGGKLMIEWANAVVDLDFIERNPGAEVGDYVALAVTDTGTGMSEETFEHAFEPFYTTKPVGEGTGLGLSMVYGFAKQSDGFVTLHSEEGKGTKVILYLPRAEEKIDQARSEATSRLPDGSGEVVLVLEDDPDVRDLVAGILGRLGYQVIEAPDARAALAVLSANEKIDLLLSDVVLPGGMSGPEFVRTARESKPAIKAMFMSGFTGEAADGNGLLEPGDIVLNKPFPRSELAEKVRTALGY